MANVKELNINSTTYDIIGKGIVDQNNTSTPLKEWSGTKAQYDAIATKDANTIYNIIDDSSSIQSILEAIYPVGAIYIGTMNICPVSALLGTWTKIGTKILLDVNTKAPVIGTDHAITVTDGTYYGGLVGVGSTYNPYGSRVNRTGNVGQTDSGDVGFGTTSKYIGLTKDSTMSGMEATVTSSALTVNIWERTA